MKQTAVEWLAEKYNYVTWMSKRDEISAGMADEWRKHYLEQAKQMEQEQIKDAYGDGLNAHRTDFCNRDEYFVKTYGDVV